jgi:hypothetical protein
VSRRGEAAEAAFARCPRCGAGREPDQRYCLECGLALPVLGGRLAGLRRGWVAHLGWYPGDFVWVALAALVLAGAFAGGAIALGRWRTAQPQRTVVAAPPSARTPPAPTGGGGWPAGVRGYTIVLSSFPARGGAAAPDALAARARAAGLPQVGVLVSSRFASLPPGYDVVFSGVYGSASEAQAALASTLARGYAGAYTAPVAP